MTDAHPPLTLVTGATGYLGDALCARLRAGGARLLRTDRAGPAADDFIAGDITDAALQARLFAQPVGTLVHLAGVVSGAAEADFELGRRVNLDATLALLERCRLQAAAGGPVVRVFFSSSVAVYGVPLPARIDDDTPQQPTLSYGTHKRAIELLIDDYTRRGFIDGRALRLPGVVVRPPMPNGALSGFNSDLFREPLAGRDYDCPVGPDATLWIASLPTILAAIERVLALPADALGARRTLNAPALAASCGEIVAALGRRDPQAPGRVRFAASPAPALLAQFGRWPLDRSFDRARALGLPADDTLDAIVADHLARSARP